MHHPEQLSRRGFVQVGLLSSFGLPFALPASRLIADETAKHSADAVLFLNLQGGPSHFETLDVKPEGDADSRGEFGTIDSQIPGLQVCDLMPKFAASAKDFSLVRGIRHTTGDHPQGQQYIGTGNRPTPALKYPSLGSVVARKKSHDPALPPYVAIPRTDWNGGYLGDAYAPFDTNAAPKKGKPFAVRGITLPDGLTVDRVQNRNSLLRDLDTRFREAENNRPLVEALSTFGRQAEAMQLSERTASAFDVSKEPESYQSLFDDSELGQSLLLATRLISFGVPFVTVRNPGWDTHENNFRGHRGLVPALDAGLISLVAGLRAKGLLERTLVVIMGEFGRTPKINKNRGRDHYPRVNWCVLVGGGIQPGVLLGATDKNGAAPTDGTDIKPDDIAATILHTIGIDHHSEFYTNTGRPVPLVPHGRVLNELL